MIFDLIDFFYKFHRIPIGLHYRTFDIICRISGFRYFADICLDTITYMELTNNQISAQRLQNQNISESNFQSVAALVSYLGAVQAQDYAMAKWAIGARIPGITEAHINVALEKGQIVRTHILRPTWHFVAAEDLRWMLDLTAPHVQRIVNNYNKKLELTDEILSKTRKIIEKSLFGNNHLTRKELMSALSQNGIETNESRAAHIMFDAELSGLVCSGIIKDKQFTYALVDETIKKHTQISGDEALDTLAFRYFKSRGPATIPDFCWWSGFTLTKARRAVEILEQKLSSFLKDGQTYYFTSDFKPSETDEKIHLLPAFDEFLISYKDRSALMDVSHYKKVVAGYGIFKPVLIKNGFVTGTWQRTIKKEEVRIQMTFLDTITKAEFEKYAEAAESFGKFLNKKVIIIR